MYRVVPIALLLVVAACDNGSSPAPIAPDPDPPAIQPGDPRPDLTAEELAAFQRGKVQFERRWQPSQGLGPMYNATSCESCHSDPVTGGSAALYRNFYVANIRIADGPSTNLGGLPSPVIPAFGPSPFVQPTFSLERGRFGIPAASPIFHVAQRNSIPILGVGLFEFISDATIMANADPEDVDGDGISGRANNDGAGMGRFGLKSQSNNIELFTRAPLMNQMGITSDPFRGSAGTVSLDHGMMVQASGNPNDLTRDNDQATDPEITAAELGDLIAFTRSLAPPRPKPFDAAATRGDAQFTALGCAKCHIPELPSSKGPVRAYTDLLIHDMGDELADDVSFGRPQVTNNDPPTTTREFRSAPLWGVSMFAPYLHDGRAATLDEAIRMHGGEAAAIRQAYENLTQEQRDDVLSFLRHL